MNHKDSKTKKIDLKIYFSGVSRKDPWGMLLGSCIPNFIEVVRLQSCQKLGELWLEGERKKKRGILNPFRLKFEVP